MDDKAKNEYRVVHDDIIHAAIEGIMQSAERIVNREPLRVAAVAALRKEWPMISLRAALTFIDYVRNRQLREMKCYVR